MNKKISVVIPAFNEEDYIGVTLESLIKNDKIFEIIIVCDLCRDKTRDISLKYTKLVYDVNFKNVSKVRNFGVNKSSGNVIVFLDADTIVSNNYITEIYKALDFYDYGCAKWKSESNNILSKYLAWNTNKYNRKNIGGNFFIKKDVFLKIGSFNEKMKRGEDTDIGERLYMGGFKKCFLEMCYIIPSERRYRKEGYIYFIIKTGILGIFYKFFRNYYNKKIASKFYD